MTAPTGQLWPPPPTLAADLAVITAADDDVIQRKAGAWANRTPAQLKTDLALTGGDVGLGNVANLAPADLPVSTAAQAALDAKQAADADLTAIAALAPADDSVMQRKAGAWTARTPAQLKTDLALVKGDVGLGNVTNTAQQPLDADLTAIAALAPPDNNVLQRKGGVWTDRTPAQLLADLGISGVNFAAVYKYGVD